MTIVRLPAEMAATTFARRHIGLSPNDIKTMLKVVGAGSLDELMSETVPASISAK